MLPIPNPHDPTQVRIPTRAEVRQLAAQQIKLVEDAILRGENYQHVLLDTDDQVNAYAAVLATVHGEDAAAALLAMWAEESAAAAQHFAFESDQALAKAHANAAVAEQEYHETMIKNAQAEQTGQYIGALLMVALLVFVGWMMFGR